ncbi:MAG: hypothetical protein JW754_05440 [Candidatus Aenigmarchaeota archaeon]|nr:hypothetical protein [Candidatus Aenigmarchaeota archaeon]
MIRWFFRKKPDQFRDKRYLAVLSLVILVLALAVFVLNPYIMAEREFGEECESYSRGKENMDSCRSFCLGPCDSKDNPNTSIKDCFYMGDMESCKDVCVSNSRIRCVMDLWASKHGFAYKG